MTGKSDSGPRSLGSGPAGSGPAGSGPVEWMGPNGVQFRIARPSSRLDATAAFYRDGLGLSVLASWEDHDGYDGVVLGMPDGSRQLELLHHVDVTPNPTSEDQLVLYLAGPEAVEALAEQIRAVGGVSRPSANPYWERDGAVCFVDPDGYWLVLSPTSWA